MSILNPSALIDQSRNYFRQDYAGLAIFVFTAVALIALRVAIGFSEFAHH